MKRHFQIFKLYFQNAFQYRATNFVWFLNAFLNPLVLLLFWRGAVSQGQNIQGWTQDIILTYYLLLILAQALLMNHVEFPVAYQDIKEGELVKELLKPYSYLKLKILGELPWRIIQGFYGITSVSVLLFVMRKSIVVKAEGILLFQALLIAALAYTLTFFFKMVLGTFAFWLTNIDSVLELNDVLTLALTGMLIPIDLFPEWMQTIVNATPYPYFIYHPIMAFINPKGSPALLQVALIQLIWIIFFYLLYRFMWIRGVRKFTGVGQ